MNTTVRIHGTLIVFMAGTALALAFRIAEAHDHGTLKLASRMFRAGDSLAVVGSKFSKRDEVTLILIGVKGRISFGEIPTDTAGAFRRVVFIPATAAVGQSRLVAEAIDGDEVASLDVTVMAAGGPSAAMPPMAGMDHMPGHEGMSMAPTGKALELDRHRSNAVIAAAVAFIIACASAGVWLLRGSHDTLTEDAS